MDSKKINQLATNVAPSIYDLTVVGDSTTGELKKITLNQIASLFGSVGGVSSVAMTVPTGLSISGSPITTSGTLALSLSSGYSIPTTAKQAEWDLGYSERLKWDGGSVGLDAPTARTSLGLVIGTNVLAYRTFGTAANNNTGDFATAAQGANADTAYSLRLTGASLPLSISGNVISIAQSTNLISGYLSSTDWNTFNNKQAALNGTGLVKSTSGTITYITDNSSNWDTAYSWGNPNGVYLPLTGGTLTGALNGTNASFSGSINNLGLNTSPTSVGTSANYLEFRNTGGDFYLGQEGSLAGGFFTGSSAYASVLYSSTAQEFIIGGVRRLQIASTGAATFSNNILVNDSFGLVNIASISTGFFPTSSLTLLLKSNGSTALTINSNLTATFSSLVTINGLGNRPVIIDSNVNIKGDLGGWAIQHGFIGSSGTNKGGFGANGNADTLSYYYVGIYGSEKLKIDYTTGAATFEGSSVNVGTIYNYSTLNILASSSPALTITDGYNGKFTFIPYENSTNGHLIRSTNYANNTYYPLTLEASRVQTPNGSLVVGGTNDNGYAFYTNGAGKFTGDLTSNSLKTSAPTGGTSQNWKLGTVVSGTCVPANFGGFTSWFTGNVIEIEVNGTTYYVPAVVPNYC